MNVSERSVEIPMPDGVAEGIVYTPESSGPNPGVIHLTDAGGIRPAHTSIARRLAAEGYLVLLPNVFYRTSKIPVLPGPFNPKDEKILQRFRELMAPITPAAMELDASAYVDFIAAQPGVAPGALGVAGYCFTGAMALRTAAVRPQRIAAAASFHGGNLATEASDSPHTALPRIKARLYFGLAVEDRTMPQEMVDRLEAALKSWGGRYQTETYAGAIHGWTASDSPAYNPAQADRAFEKLRDFFGSVLKRPATP